MSKPLLPSEKHPDYPKGQSFPDHKPCGLFIPASGEAIAAFYKAHPEFNNEGSYEFQCPFCGSELSQEHNYCCGEAGHGEWIHLDSNGEPTEDV